jgi:ankyrin repeat protein
MRKTNNTNNTNNTNLFLEYNTFYKKEEHIYKNHVKSVIQSVTEGFQDINRFNMCSVWDDIYIEDVDSEEEIHKLINDIVSKLFVKKLSYFITGPLIKSILINTDISKIRRDLFIYPVAVKNTIENNVSDFVNKDIVIDNGTVYIGAINGCKIILSKYFIESIPQILFKSPALDRICYFENKFMISGMFALEFFKYTSIYSENTSEIDPYLKIPRDILNVYNKSIYKQSKIQKIIDMINIHELPSITEYDASTMIFFMEQRKSVTAIEYALFRYYNEYNPMFKYNLKSIITLLCTFTYIRDPLQFAYAIRIDETDPDIYRLLSTKEYKYSVKFRYNIENTLGETDVESIIHEINMLVLHEITKNDDIEFVNYLDIIGYSNRVLMDKNSKTGKKIINYLTENNSSKIIESLVTSDRVHIYYKYYMILLSEHLNLMECIEDDKYDYIPDYIEEIINRGLIRTFYYMIKTDYEKVMTFKISGNNILHLLGNKNRSDDILNIVLKTYDSLINEKNNEGYTPLHIYAMKRYESKLDIALSYEQTDYTILDNDNNSVLHHIAMTSSEIIKNCTRRIVDILDIQNKNGETAIMVACKHQFEDIFYILKGFDANLTLVDNHGNTVYHYICLNGICCSLMIPLIENNYGYTPRDYCKISFMYYNFI